MIFLAEYEQVIARVAAQLYTGNVRYNAINRWRGECSIRGIERESGGINVE